MVDAAAARSAFIIRLVDAFETRNALCFVTELAAFGDLQHVFAKLPGRRANEHVVRSLFADIVLGLEECHRLGYLYRDLKLGNLLVTGSGHVRLADFGLAKRLDVQYASSALSSESGSESVEDDEPFRLVGRAKSFVGTRRYMSPEHLRRGDTGQREYGAASDVWALGVSLYLMLVGNYPFGRAVSKTDSQALRQAISDEQILFPGWLGQDAIGMLKGLLNRDALQRFDLAEIKSHPWMKGTDWAKVRADSQANIPREDVLAILKEGGAKMIDGVRNFEQAANDRDVFSSLSGSGSDSFFRRKRNQYEPAMEFVGFGYLNL